METIERARVRVWTTEVETELTEGALERCIQPGASSKSSNEKNGLEESIR